MMSERALVEAIFKTALRGTAGDTAARRDALWAAATMKAHKSNACIT
jgi:hypothetical protein